MAHPIEQIADPKKPMPPLYRQVRWWILALLFLLTVINFVDRQALAVLGNDITDEFKLSSTAFGTIVSWFRFSMLVGEFPMGMLMDRVGVRFMAALMPLPGVGLALWTLKDYRRVELRYRAIICLRR